MVTTAAEIANRVRAGLQRAIVGNADVLDALLVALLADGHVLIEGVPGTAKTLVVRTVARLVQLDFRRIQFTPDLLPSDVVGTSVYDPRSTEFSIRRGPVFTNVLLADEINRTPPKTQAALLEAMEERQVTLDGEPLPLPAPFVVCATQNPIEFEGTYPLPEAQLDRFLVRARTGYPSPDEERDLVARAVAGFDARDLGGAGIAAVADAADLGTARAEVRAVHVEPSVQRYLADLAAATRRADGCALGASPRATLGLLGAARAAAAIAGRTFVVPDDVKAIAGVVLAHRLVVQPEAELDGVTAEGIVQRVLAAVPLPAPEPNPA